MKDATALNIWNTHRGIHKFTINIFSDLYKYKYNLTLLVEMEKNHKKRLLYTRFLQNSITEI